MDEQNDGQYFDLQGQFDEEIKPIMVALAERCDELGLPHVISIQFVSTPVKDGVATASGMGNSQRDASSRIMLASAILSVPLNHYLIEAIGNIIGSELHKSNIQGVRPIFNGLSNSDN